MFEFHLMIDALSDGADFYHPILRFVFRHHRIHLQIIPFIRFAGSSDSHTSIQPHVLTLSDGIAEVVAHQSVVGMKYVNEICNTLRTVIKRHVVVLIPLFGGISSIVDDINSGISQLGKVGSERDNLVELVYLLRVVLLARLVHICHEIGFRFTKRVIYLTVSCHDAYSHYAMLRSAYILLERQKTVVVFKSCVNKVLFSDFLLCLFREQCTLENIEFLGILEFLHSEDVHSPVVGKGDRTIGVIHTQSYRHRHKHLFQFVSLSRSIIARLLQSAPQHHQVGEVLQP